MNKDKGSKSRSKDGGQPGPKDGEKENEIETMELPETGGQELKLDSSRKSRNASNSLNREASPRNPAESRKRF